MGNRAVISFDSADDHAIAVYVQWNGGRDSIEAFLKATRILMGGRLGDELYGRARFIQVVGLNFTGALSFGVGTVKEFGGWNCDNGLYIIDSATMTIKGRKFDDYYDNNTFVEQQEHDLNKMVNELINTINAGYKVYNVGMTYPEPLLPTAEVFDAIEAKEKEIALKQGELKTNFFKDDLVKELTHLQAELEELKAK